MQKASVVNQRDMSTNVVCVHLLLAAVLRGWTDQHHWRLLWHHAPTHQVGDAYNYNKWIFQCLNCFQIELAVLSLPPFLLPFLPPSFPLSICVSLSIYLSLSLSLPVSVYHSLAHSLNQSLTLLYTILTNSADVCSVH